MHPKHSAKIIDIATLRCRIGPIHHNLKLLHVKWVSRNADNQDEYSFYKWIQVSEHNEKKLCEILVTVATFRQNLASEMHPKHFAICNRHCDKFVMYTPYQWLAI